MIFPETPLYTLPISVMVRKNPQSISSFENSQFTIGVITGSSSEGLVPKKQFSEVNEMIFDAGAYSKPPPENAAKEHPDKLRILDEPFAYTTMHLIISPVTKISNLAEQVDEFLIKMKSDCTIDKMRQYWIVEKNTQMPPIPAPEHPAQKLTVGTSGTLRIQLRA